MTVLSMALPMPSSDWPARQGLRVAQHLMNGCECSSGLSGEFVRVYRDVLRRARQYSCTHCLTCSGSGSC